TGSPGRREPRRSPTARAATRPRPTWLPSSALCRPSTHASSSSLRWTSRAGPSGAGLWRRRRLPRSPSSPCNTSRFRPTSRGRRGPPSTSILPVRSARVARRRSKYPCKRMVFQTRTIQMREVPLLDSGPIDLELLANAVHGARTANPAPVDVTDLAYDARRVTPGALFVCVPGMKADGHDYAPKAVADGAAALIVERDLDLMVPQLVVADAREAMALAADAFFGHPTRELEVAGVTGTNGKTTTAFLLFAILAAAGRRPGLLGTIENRVGGERRAAVRTTSEAIDVQRLLREMLDGGDRSCAMEATSHGSALKRLLGIRFAVLVFTNLS